MASAESISLPHCIGILGCGHLGQGLALSAKQHGFGPGQLLISYRGSAQTTQRLATQGLAAYAVSNAQLLEQADLIFITLKPSDVLSLRELPVKPQVRYLSCVAGVPTAALEKILGCPVHRMMLSGPETFPANQGLAALYPPDAWLTELLSKLGIRTLALTTEDELDVFTVGACIPAALVQSGPSAAAQQAIVQLSKSYPLLTELYQWATQVTPQLDHAEAKQQYITKMATPGGITEAIIRSLREGHSFDRALPAGLARTKAISAEIRQSLVAG